jgi:phytoene synthase
MTPETYCTERAAPPGSALHYCLRGTAERPRRLVTALYALAAELSRAAAASHDPGICAARLQWWRDELQRVPHGAAAHPVALALSDGLHHGDIELATLDELIDANEAEAIGFRPTDLAALIAHARRAGAPLARSAARVLLAPGTQEHRGRAEPPWLEAATARLGEASWLVAMLRDVGLDARRGRVYLPIALMQSVNLPVATLLASSAAAQSIRQGPQTSAGDTRFDDLMRLLANATGRLQEEGLAGIAPEARRALRPLLAMTGIERALVAEIAGDPGSVMRGRIALTPVRMLWISWRASRGN